MLSRPFELEPLVSSSPDAEADRELYPRPKRRSSVGLAPCGFLCLFAPILLATLVVSAFDSYYYGVEGNDAVNRKLKWIPTAMLTFASGVYTLLDNHVLCAYKLPANMMFAFALSLAGDITLAAGSDDLCLGFGTAFFCGVQVFFILASSKAPHTGDPPVGWHISRGIPYFAGLVGGGYWITSAMVERGEGGVTIAGVLLYGILVVAASWRAAARVGYDNNLIETRSSQVLALIASLLFIVSGILIASNRFVSPIHYAEIYILNIYWAAQLLYFLSLQREQW